MLRDRMWTFFSCEDFSCQNKKSLSPGEHVRERTTGEQVLCYIKIKFPNTAHHSSVRRQHVTHIQAYKQKVKQLKYDMYLQ